MWQHDKYLDNPIMWLCGPRFLVVWNIHISCNSSCATHGIVTCGIMMHGIVTCGTGHTCDSHEWNTCRHRHAINICYSSAINPFTAITAIWWFEVTTRAAIRLTPSDK